MKRALVLGAYLTAVVVSALVPDLRIVSVVLVVLGTFALLGAALRGPGRTTGSNSLAMQFRISRGSSPGEEAASDYRRRHGLD